MATPFTFQNTSTASRKTSYTCDRGVLRPVHSVRIEPVCEISKPQNWLLMISISIIIPISRSHKRNSILFLTKFHQLYPNYVFPIFPPPRFFIMEILSTDHRVFLIIPYSSEPTWIKGQLRVEDKPVLASSFYNNMHTFLAFLKYLIFYWRRSSIKCIPLYVDS